MILQTVRLILRKMTQDDFPALCRILQDPAVMYAYEGPFDDTGVQDWLDRQLSRYEEDGIGLWAVVHKQTGEMIGQCGLTLQDCNGRTVTEVGYLFMQKYWHQGYATEAAVACRQYAFEELGLQEVYSIIRDTNLPSQRVAQRNGMVPTEQMTKFYRGVTMPHLVFRVRREEIQ